MINDSCIGINNIIVTECFKRNPLVVLISAIRPLKFNYLSYELFLRKKSCQTPKKKRKKSTLVSYGRKWFRNFLSFKNIYCED